MRSFVLLLLAAAVLGCDSPPPPSTGAAQGAVKDAAKKPLEIPGLTFPAPKRLVAIGDVHGDLDATKRALKLAGAIDDSGAWAGGDLFVVQVGDQLDRGDDDRAILDLFEKLTAQAKDKGGTFLAINGNHEIMNAQLDFRYATDGSNPPFDEFAASAPAPRMKFPEALRGRAAAFVPGGPYAKKLADRPLYAIVGDSVFVHGGILPKHVDYGLEKLDKETRAWLRGEGPSAPAMLLSDDGPIWSRMYSAATGREECATLGKVLDRVGVKRMVMGHTPQKPGISPTCDDRAWRIDTGMARAYGGKVEVLEIAGDGVKVLRD